MRKVGLLFFPRDEETVVGTVRVMEDLGYERVGLVDSHALAMDVYVGLTLAAVNSSRLRLGPCVTNPVTRDVSVRLRREYLVTEHMQLGDRHNADLIDRLELSDYLLDRFAFAGTPEELRAKVEWIESMGIENFMFNVCMSADLKHDARMIAEALGLT